jgi:hypothetical protein
MFALWAYVLQHGANILEYEHPSNDIEHSIKKNVFIDSLGIIDPDTIKTNRFQRIDIFPTSSWIEKKAYWKSATPDLDSLGFLSDTVELIVNFRNFVNGKPWAPKNSGDHIINFNDGQGDTASVYMDDETTQLSFTIPMMRTGDTIELTSDSSEKIVLMKRRK